MNTNKFFSKLKINKKNKVKCLSPKNLYKSKDYKIKRWLIKRIDTPTINIIVDELDKVNKLDEVKQINSNDSYESTDILL